MTDGERMNLDLTEAEEAFRLEVRSWLEQNVPRKRMAHMDTADGLKAHCVWERQLYDARLAVLTWPARFGGRNASLTEWMIFEEEYFRAGGPARVSQNGITLLAPTLFEFGTPEQQERFLPGIASAEEIWAQAWSEPEAGSDLASIRSVARRGDSGWWLSGQKTWSSRAAVADWGFGPFRTDPDAKRHHGLTYFLFPLDSDGVTVRPIHGLDGAPVFAEIFLEDVFVPDYCVVGDVGAGWAVAMRTTTSERGLALRSPGRYLASVDRLLELWRRVGRERNMALRDHVVDVWVGAHAYRLQTLETVSRFADGAAVGVESSLNKIFWSELDIGIHEAALDLLDGRAELRPEAASAVDDGTWIDGFLFAQAGTIYAGTNEIQRTIIAERVLGLPRDPR
jgi:alkylation response protein AidB-like acyl-CoA dehydrogenase